MNACSCSGNDRDECDRCGAKLHETGCASLVGNPVPYTILGYFPNGIAHAEDLDGRRIFCDEKCLLAYLRAQAVG